MKFDFIKAHLINSCRCSLFDFLHLKNNMLAVITNKMIGFRMENERKSEYRYYDIVWDYIDM